MRYQCDGCEEIIDESDLDRDEMGEILCPVCGNDELTELEEDVSGESL
jgi:uncharacterized Zn finger protein (UPF0148 family)